MGVNMKKITFLISIFLFSISVNLYAKSVSKTDELVLEDLKYFKQAFEEGYVFYDDLAKDNNVTLNENKCLKKYNSLKNKKSTDKQGKNIVNGINQDALLSPLWWFLKNLNPQDGHLAISTNERDWKITNGTYLYKSDYYFKKEGNDFFLFKCPDSKLLKQKYTGKIEDLKKTVLNNEEVYVFAPDTKSYIEETKINLNKKITIPVKYVDMYDENRSKFKINETEDSIYVKISSFHMVENTKEDLEFMDGLLEISDKISEKKNIIIDLRNNGGGYNFYTRELVAAIYNKRNSEAERKEVWEFLHNAAYGQISLKSNIIAQENYKSAIKNHQSNSIIDSALQELNKQKQINKKYYETLYENHFKKLPQFSGKKCNAKIIVLIDNYTASASEFFITYLYMMDKSNVILVGQNSAGIMGGGGRINYELPNSKLLVSFVTESYKNTAGYLYSPTWKGETNGFYPDYWVTENSFFPVLFYLTNDSELKNFKL